MADNNVRFIRVALQSTYDALPTKDPRALYWILENSRLYVGSQLFATGEVATAQFKGLLSAEDYASLQALISAGPSAGSLVPVDSSIVISNGKIGVQVSKEAGNLLSVKSDGIFATVDAMPITKVTGLEDRLVGIEESIAELDDVKSIMSWQEL